MAASPGSRLVSLRTLRLAPRVERWIRRVVPRPVQRIGAQALDRVVRRFPRLAELLDGSRQNGGREKDVRRETPAPVRAADPVPEAAKPGVRAEVGRRASPGAGPLGDAAGGAPAVDPVLGWLADLEAPDWSRRVAAATALATVEVSSLHRDRLATALVRALRDESAEVAAAAALAIVRQRTPSAVEALAVAVENADGYLSPVTRAACVQALGQCGSAEHRGVILGAIRDLDAEVSIAAIATAADCAPAEAAPALRALLSDESGFFLPVVRHAAARALERIS